MRLRPILTAVALAALVAACGKSEQTPPAGAAPAAEAPKLSPEDKQKLLVSLPAPYNGGDLDNGQAKFALCQSCHTITPGGANMTGPNLHGIFGKKAATSPDFKYSDALKATGWTWDANHLDQWLAKPQDYLPGTKMTFAGLKDAKDRVDLIAFLMVETGHKP